MPNQPVSSQRMRVWMVEVAAIVIFMALMVWFMSSQLQTERDAREDSAEKVANVLCIKINKNSQRLNDTIAIAATPPEGATPQQIARAEAFRTQALKGYHPLICKKLAKELRGD